MNFVISSIEMLRRKWRVRLFVVGLRFLTAISFIPSGLKKIFNLRFTSLSLDSSIGFFFEKLYSTGVFYQFLGWVQLFTALLLMTQRFATLGALLFFCIIFNIWVITISLPFSGTWLVTSSLLLSSILLMAWDLRKFLFLLSTDGKSYPKYRILKSYNKIWVYLGMLLFVISVIYSCLVAFEFHTLFARWVAINIYIVSLLLGSYKEYHTKIDDFD